MDIFETLIYLPRPESWDPRVAPLIEELRSRLPGEIDDEEMALEIWATMGGTTQRELKRRTKLTVDLDALIRDSDVTPGWPTIARCLVRLGSSNVPGCYFAGLTLVEVVTEARRVGVHAGVLGPAAVAGWTDEGRDPFRKAILRRLTAEEAAPSYAEQMGYDGLSSHAEQYERGMFGDG